MDNYCPGCMQPVNENHPHELCADCRDELKLSPSEPAPSWTAEQIRSELECSLIFSEWHPERRAEMIDEVIAGLQSSKDPQPVAD